MDAAATWAFLLLALGLVFLVLEFFVPSSGALAVMCALSLLGAIGIGFAAGPWTGASILLIVVIVVPTSLVAAVNWWPETPIGRLILIQRPKSSDEVLPQTPAYRSFKDLVGRRGVAKNLMLPSGMVVIEGKSYEAISEGTPIEAGQPILVVSISTQRLIVRPDNTIRAELAESTAEDTAGYGQASADTGGEAFAAEAAALTADGEAAIAAAFADDSVPYDQAAGEEAADAPLIDPDEPLIKDIPDPFADEPRTS